MLFSFLGATYQDDGRKTFGFSDLRGKVTVHTVTYPRLKEVRQGDKSGGHKTININKSSDEGTTLIYEQPTNSVRYIICLMGNFPSRS
ncbi:hypothetical protein KH5_22590 [Urechidicola sp. KH5]